MIIGFKDKETEKIFYRSYSRHLPIHIQRKALLKLRFLHACRCLEDFMVPPGNRFEALHGDREGQCSIRINKQYRICFRIDEDCNLHDVEIVDYH
ncbi:MULTISPECIES: type II toxin-antitoxin system RelE/ParE family toxin [Veillonella]|uniref:type II toxin-antitoxin system RelE/ParE family toxin n=1 Tax=Veillonella TaxID=29465 RepID=UPI0004B399B4|nr:MULTISPECIES: type II toxin-antitoxin system RelE/ParE family toxin [Veillonella]